jgi:uridine monophosphate synthetase
MLVPVSRAISRAADPSQAARDLRDAINAARASQPIARKTEMHHARLADDLLRLGCVQFGEFKLKSGGVSPIYLDLRRLVGDPAALARAASTYVELMRPMQFDRIAGLPYAALPMAAAISLQSGWPLVYPRKESKDYGTRSPIEGPYANGETIAVIDDLITTGGSKFEAIEKLESAGLRVRDIVVLVDRRPEGEHELAARDLQLHALFQLPELLAYWQSNGDISVAQHDEVVRYLQGK